MSVRVEFLGLARHHAGVESIDLVAGTLGEIFRQLPDRLPGTITFFADGELGPTYLASINGQGFTRDRETALQDGDAVLILSADAGG